MGTANEGGLDRGIRVVAGLVALGLAFMSLSGIWQIAAIVVGLVLLVTGAVGVCPLYAVLGINTCPLNSRR